MTTDPDADADDPVEAADGSGNPTGEADDSTGTTGDSTDASGDSGHGSADSADHTGDAGDDLTVGRAEKLRAIREAALYDPRTAALVLLASLFTAVLEGVGVSFILPIVEFTDVGAAGEGALRYFERAFDLVSVPFTLETMILALLGVMVVRFGASFLVRWLRARLNADYKRTLRRDLFEAIADAPIDYLDAEGSDALLNSVVTETDRAGVVVTTLVDVVETGLRGVIYLALAFALSPPLTILAGVGFTLNTLFSRYVLESAYAVGDDVADANERIQTVSQTGIQGMRDVRLFGMADQLVERMRTALDDFFEAGVRLERNQAAMSGLNQFLNGVVVTSLIYLGISSGFTVGELGVFLFAIYRLSPVASQLNNLVYGLDGMLPHHVRVTSRVHELRALSTPASGGDRPVSSVDRVAFEDVTFSYGDEEADRDGKENRDDLATDRDEQTVRDEEVARNDEGEIGGEVEGDSEVEGDDEIDGDGELADERVLDELSFEVERGEHVALVGQSGAGKSTVVSLLARLQTPDDGRILADGTPIDEFDVEQWRERLAVVRQDPYVFDETLRENVTVGDPAASQADVERACEIAQVTEFLGDLPDGYDTVIGEDGVRLSGGQKQRVAVARALLKDADVLVLDEATSDLDSHIERDVQAAIERTATEYATVSIAHRLSTVRDADRIYVLEDGSVVEGGTHEELLTEDGIYADLYRTQSGEELATPDAASSG